MDIDSRFVDRAALDKRSCKCSSLVKKDYERLLRKRLVT